jgi:Putative Flp pilus-assembly TadE/G-like
MTKMLLKKGKVNSRKERGQVLILVALAIVGIVAILGIAMDVGIMFLEDARLRRAVDSAALAAALQYRSGVVDLNTQLKAAAEEYLVLNDIHLNPADPDSVEVHTCTDQPSMCYDAAQGVTIPRKLVSVKAKATVDLVFLPVIGIDKVGISASATGESASLDLVLALDTSESMTFDAPGVDPLRDPSVCNDDAAVVAKATLMGWGTTDPLMRTADGSGTGVNIDTADGMPGECHPFEEIKNAARQFLSNLYFPYDRVAIVTFDKYANTWLNFDENCDLHLHPSGCTADEIKATITTTIKNLKVYEAGKRSCPDGNGNGEPCLPYCKQDKVDGGYCNHDYPENFVDRSDPNAVFAGSFDCGRYADGTDYHYGAEFDPHECMTTNIASGFYYSGTAFCGTRNCTSGSTAMRTSSLWVVVILTDGAANMGTFNDADNTPACPYGTWDPYREPGAPRCRDISSLTRHCANAATWPTCQAYGNGLDDADFRNGVFDPLNYDADDAAHDAADYVGLTQQAVIFSIGFTDMVTSSDYSGERLLKYAAEKVGNGAYFYGADSTKLAAIFKQIGDKIATRLAR